MPKVINYVTAVKTLDEYLQKKTVHAAKDLLAMMQTICSLQWVNQQEQNDFANLCNNFDLYVKNNSLTSIGRKQFEKWWDIADMLPEDPLPEFTVSEAVDILQEHFEAADNSHEGHDLRKENQELRKRNQELLARLNKAEQTLAKIREAVLWGSSN